MLLIVVFTNSILRSQSAFEQAQFPMFSQKIQQILSLKENEALFWGAKDTVVSLNIKNKKVNTFKYSAYLGGGPIYFIDTLTGWMTNSSGWILKTTDGGKSWESIGFLDEDASLLEFSNRDTGWAAGDYIVSKTTDGGVTWSSFPQFASLRFKSLKVVTTQYIYILGYNNSVYRTTDGGGHWDSLSRYSENLNDLYFKDTLNVWACTTSGTIIKSSDGGKTWLSVLRNPGRDLQKISFRGNFGFCIGSLGTIIRSTDSGGTWQVTFLPLKLTNNVFQFLNDSSIVVANNRNDLFFTEDYAVTWKHFAYPSVTFYSVASIKPGQFVVVGSSGAFVKNDINTGFWLEMESPTGYSYNHYDVVVPDTNLILIGTTNGYIFVSFTAGRTWGAVFPGVNSPIRKLFFINKSIGWYISFTGEIGQTTNTGLTWTRQYLGNNLNSSIYFINKDTGWAAGFPAILKTTDGGFNWTVQSAPRDYYSGVYFHNSKNGLAITGDGNIYKSSDGGNSWVKTDSGKYGLTNICFSSKTTGWIIGNGGTLFKTIDGGQSWVKIDLGINSYLHSISFSDSLNGIIAGTNSLILKTNNGGITFVHEVPDSKYSPNKTAEVFPNPFITSVNISYTLPSPGFVSLIIYNSLGQEIETLVEQEQQPGEHTTVFQGKDKAAGVYFYRLVCGNEIITGKMLLVR